MRGLVEARWLFAVLLFICCRPADTGRDVSLHNIVWRKPSNSSAGSMPIGNGDLAANVWVDGNGDVNCLLAKGDAWSGLGRLLKIGLVTISISPRAPLLVKDLEQILQLTNASIRIHGKEVELEVSIDVSSNTLRATVTASTHPVTVDVSIHIWRNRTRSFLPGESSSAYGSTCYLHQLYPDTLLSAPMNSLIWFHRNNYSVFRPIMQLQHLCGDKQKLCEQDPLLNRTFGASVRGESWDEGGDPASFERRSDTTL
eukprot:3657065-Rhodomonas_salina.1